VTAIVEDLCGLPAEKDAAFEFSGARPVRRIHLNASESPERRRSTLAHERGHWRLYNLGLMDQPTTREAAQR
jgi:Zn-dependent peptidase ImmA (M78 family)